MDVSRSIDPDEARLQREGYRSAVSDAKVVDDLFVRVLSRPATQPEIEAGVKALHETGDEHAKLSAALTEYQTKLDSKQAEWETSQASPTWTVLDPAEMTSSMGASFAKQSVELPGQIVASAFAASS